MELLEEAVQILRTAPLVAFMTYLSGAIPFAMGLLFFWARATWMLPALGEIMWSATGLVLLFLWLKVCQARFVECLHARRLGIDTPSWSWRSVRRVASRQLRYQPVGLFVLPAAFAIVLPFPWVFAWFQNLTVLEATAESTKPLGALARAQAELWPRQNCIGLLSIGGLSFFIFLNVTSAILFGAWLATHVLGMQTPFGLSGWTLLNTTFLAVVAILTWLAVDPLVKSFYFLRVFYGCALANGDDLRIDLAAARRRRAAGLRIALIAAVAGWISGDSRLWASESTLAPPVTAVDPAGLNRAIGEVLSGGNFQWRIHPPRPPANRRRSVIEDFFSAASDTLVSFARMIHRWWVLAIDWLDRLFPRPRDEREPRAASGTHWIMVLRALLYVMAAAIVAGVGWAGWLIWRRNRSGSALDSAVPAVAIEPDLRDDAIHASLLSSDGWLTLARGQIAKGEWRLAMRALYLATLAGLAAEGLVRLAKHKTNLEYEHELARRAHSRADLIEGFAHRRLLFEKTWYGNSPAEALEVHGWLGELEGRR